MCMGDTRMRLRQDILSWLRGASSSTQATSSKKLYWVFGLAGSGKSALANTIAETVEKDPTFDLSCFCCKRDDPELSQPGRLFTTLAYRIAQYYPSYRAALVSLLLSPEGAGVVTGDVGKQFTMLFGDLLPKTTEPPRTHVVVIDALDECEKDVCSELLSTIRGLQLQINVSLLVTTRQLREVLDHLPSYPILEVRASESDITIYLRARMRTLPKFVQTDRALQDMIVTAIVSAVDGM